MEIEIKNKAMFASWLSNILGDDETHTAERLRRFGLTEEEIVAWDEVAEAATACLALPDLHGMGRHELCHFFHTIQDWILARPGLRALKHEIGKGSGQDA